MKELENHHADQVRNVSQKEVKKQTKYYGSTRLKPGHKIWEINMGTGEINEATYHKVDADYKSAVEGVLQVRKKIIMKENCSYIGALNKKNAMKRLKKMQQAEFEKSRSRK